VVGQGAQRRTAAWEPRGSYVARHAPAGPQAVSRAHRRRARERRPTATHAGVFFPSLVCWLEGGCKEEMAASSNDSKFLEIIFNVIILM
jgi:hypothetical protein